jgi:alginate O-acetyltransferase complex protein AlgI
MLFNSFQYLYFFVSLFVLYFMVVPRRYHWLLLLLASCYFYMAYIPKFIFILFFLITVDYVLGRAIASAAQPRRKWLLIVSITANLSTLFFFKYFNFFNQNVARIAQLIHWNYSPLLLEIALPLGLSFHVFQSLSYVIEVYKGKQEPERHYGIYALYVMFFPQLVAGPIERPQHLLYQFHEEHPFSALQARQGLELILIGLFKKMVIADWVAVIVNHVYSNIIGINGMTIFLTSILFTYQIYCDFSGYSDIAVGSALVFGYDITYNFNRPFASRSIAEFWRRWHISLSSWLKDYLYYPLAFMGERRTKFKLYSSLFITFTLIGLWHGANWTYVVFGMIHGIYLVFAALTAPARKTIRETIRLTQFPKLEKAWQVLAVFLLVTASFIFFRSDSVSQGMLVFLRIGQAFLNPLSYVIHPHSIISFESLGLTTGRFLIIVSFILLLELIQYFQAKRGSVFIFERSSKAARWGWYYALVFAVIFFGFLGSESFIYFKF